VSAHKRSIKIKSTERELKEKGGPGGGAQGGAIDKRMDRVCLVASVERFWRDPVTRSGQNRRACLAGFSDALGRKTLMAVLQE
jgi:hypothetical protein